MEFHLPFYQIQERINNLGSASDNREGWKHHRWQFAGWGIHACSRRNPIISMPASNREQTCEKKLFLMLVNFIQCKDFLINESRVRGI